MSPRGPKPAKGAGSGAGNSARGSAQRDDGRTRAPAAQREASAEVDVDTGAEDVHDVDAEIVEPEVLPAHPLDDVAQELDVPDIALDDEPGLGEPGLGEPGAGAAGLGGVSIGGAEREREHEHELDRERERERTRASRLPARTGATLPVPFDPLARYIQEARQFPELDRDEEQRLARAYRDTGDREAARRLVTSNLMLVVRLALMYRRAIRNVMDLIQEGNVGLLEALKRFDPDQGVRFPTYAAWWIKAYMLKFLLDNARLVRVGTTNARRKLLYNLRRERSRLEQLGVTTTPKLLADHFGVSEADVVDVEKALASRDMSFDTPLTDDGGVTLGDTLPAPHVPADEAVAAQEIRERVSAAIAEFRETLGERDREILDGRLLSEEAATLQELGDRYGVTREAMRQAENKLKEKLARFLRERLGDEVVLRFVG